MSRNFPPKFIDREILHEEGWRSAKARPHALEPLRERGDEASKAYQKEMSSDITRIRSHDWRR